MTRPTAMAPDASTSPVDWSRPIEAVHEDGRVMAVTGIHDWSNDQWPHSGVADHEHIFMRDDGRCSRATWGDMPGWRIRNVQPTTPERDPALWDRMEALVRRIGKGFHMHGANDIGISSYEAVALAEGIVRDLPKPVDPDLILAREMAKEMAIRSDHRWGKEPFLSEYNSGALDDNEKSGVSLALHAIKRGRELAAPEVSHVG